MLPGRAFSSIADDAETRALRTGTDRTMIAIDGKHRNVGWVAVHAPLLIACQALYALAYVRLPWLRSAVLAPTIFRLLVWTLPVVAYLLLCREDWATVLGLRQNAFRSLLAAAAIGLCLIAASYCQRVLFGGRAHFAAHLSLDLWVGPILLVGASEEVVFRGFYLPLLAERFSFAAANLWQALLFLAIHIPGWIILHRFASMSALEVFALGLILGWLRRRFDSLWGCALLHSLNNLAALAFP